MTRYRTVLICFYPMIEKLHMFKQSLIGSKKKKKFQYLLRAQFFPQNSAPVGQSKALIPIPLPDFSLINSSERDGASPFKGLLKQPRLSLFTKFKVLLIRLI